MYATIAVMPDDTVGVSIGCFLDLAFQGDEKLFPGHMSHIHRKFVKERRWDILLSGCRHCTSGNNTVVLVAAFIV